MQSVINQELGDRHKLLADILNAAPKEGIPVSNAMTGRAVALLPGIPLMNGVPGSKMSNNLEAIQDTFEESVRVGVRPFTMAPGMAFPYYCQSADWGRGLKLCKGMGAFRRPLKSPCVEG